MFENGTDADVAVLQTQNRVKLAEARLPSEVVVQGLYERYRVDPRITPKALALYEKMVEKHFGKTALKK